MCTHKGSGWNPHAKPYPRSGRAALVLVYGSLCMDRGILLIWEISQGVCPTNLFHLEVPDEGLLACSNWVPGEQGFVQLQHCGGLCGGI